MRLVPKLFILRWTAIIDSSVDLWMVALEQREGLVPKMQSLSDDLLDNTVQVYVFMWVEIVNVACKPKTL